MGGTLTTVYIRIGAFLPFNPSPTTLCVCHSGFLIVSEYFPDDWCINMPLGAQQTQKEPDIQLVQSNFTNIAAQNVNKAFTFVYIGDCNLPLIFSYNARCNLFYKLMLI